MPFFSFSQKDTVQVYPLIEISGNHLEIAQHNTLNKKELENISPIDLGDVLQYLNGYTIKSYGGIGGMKSLSYRGLGGQHTQLLIDGTPVNNIQTGQVNFANIPSYNIQKVKTIHGNKNQLLPVSALVKGNVISLTTKGQSFSSPLFSLNTSVGWGSFGKKTGSLSLKKGGKNNYVNLSGNIRYYEGNYPYKLNGKNYRRRNNSVMDYTLRLGTGFRWESKNAQHILRLSGKMYSISQELPGAVVFYNNLSAATLQTERENVGLTYRLFSSKWHFFAYGKYQHHFLHYYDPNYLNSKGYLDNQYTTPSINGGFHLTYSLKQFDFHLGSDIQYDNLSSNRNLGHPIRFSNTSMIKLRYNNTYFYVDASLFSQLFWNQNTPQNHRKIYHKFHPQLAIYTSDKLFPNLQFYAWYKPSSRTPSFNELYYSQVGNKALEPEESSQINVGVEYVMEKKQFQWSIKGDLYRNKVRNKILALPTKNLFVWSIQNVGKVGIWGGDIHFKAQYSFFKNWKIHTSLGFNYTRAVDISKKNSPTYKNQISYIPKITGNLLFGINYKNIGLHFSGLYIGSRYSLNENIQSNYLPSYFIMGLSGSYDWKISKKHKIKIQAGVKNIANESYNFVRYFIMPGRNYYIKLSYAFN